MKKIIHLFVFLLLILVELSAFAQKNKHGIQYKFNIQKYRDSPQVTYYGWDFSNMKACDKNIYSYLIKDKNIPYWVHELNDIFSVNETRRKLDKNDYTADLSSIQDLYKSKNFQSFLTNDRYELAIDSIRAIVKNYDLPQKSGCGFVIIVENLNRVERFVSAYMTFFDIQTREVLWTTRMKGLPGGKSGVEVYYRSGFIEVYKYFFIRYY
jgi:hypothetical protein